MIEFDVDMGYLTDCGTEEPPDEVVLNDENGEYGPVSYIRLPTDMDGKTIHMGDILDMDDYTTGPASYPDHHHGFKAKTVTGICIVAVGEDAIEVDDGFMLVNPKRCRHHKEN